MTLRNALILALGASALMLGCGEQSDDSEIHPGGDEEVTAPGGDGVTDGFSPDNKEQSVELVTRQLNDAGTAFENLKTWVERVGDNVPTDVTEAQADIEQALADAREQLETMKNTTGDAWQDLRDQLETKISEVQVAISDAINKVKAAAPSVPGMPN
jgi:hypothetical protein